MGAQKHIERIREALAMGPTGGEWRGGDAYGAVVTDEPVVGITGSDNVAAYGGHLVGESICEKNRAYIAAACPAALLTILSHIDTQAAEIEHWRLRALEAENIQAAEIERLRALHREMAEDTERLNWLNANHGSGVFCVGSRWYTRRSYGMPWRRRADLRDAIDAARKEADHA